jgi:hypothetical protein
LYQINWLSTAALRRSCHWGWSQLHDWKGKDITGTESCHCKGQKALVAGASESTGNEVMRRGWDQALTAY